jgi:hypothetical protein
VVFESRPRWEPELQRQFREEPVRVRGCRTWSELTAFVFPPLVEVVCIDLPDDMAECLQWLSKLVTQPKAPAVIAFSSSEAADLEWTLRDAGVRDVLVGDLSGERLARICRRKLGLQPSVATQK